MIFDAFINFNAGRRVKSLIRRL